MAGNMTVCLLNWKRPDNLLKIIERLRAQTDKPTVFLWNNAGGDSQWFENVDWQINSSVNRFCPPRWYMAMQATTPYVMTLDDDLCPNNNEFIEYIVNCFDELPETMRLLGPFGKKLINSRTYELCPNADQHSQCEIILGRMMVMRREDIVDRISLPELQHHATTDDIAVSAMIGGKYGKYNCCTDWRDQLEELPDNDALCHEPGHFIRREEARRRWFRK